MKTTKTGPFRITLRTEEVQAQVKQATLATVTEVFELDIKAAAMAGSPVKSGNNKRMIDTEVSQKPEGVKAELFTQSGYGGYLEVGHVARRGGIGPPRFVSPRPYLWPAFQKGISTIAEKVKEELKNG